MTKFPQYAKTDDTEVLVVLEHNQEGSALAAIERVREIPRVVESDSADMAQGWFDAMGAVFAALDGAPGHVAYDEIEYALAVDPEDMSIVVAQSQDQADPLEMQQWIPQGVLVQRRVRYTEYEPVANEGVTHD